MYTEFDYAVPLNGKNRGYIPRGTIEPRRRPLINPVGICVHSNGAMNGELPQTAEGVVLYWVANTWSSAHDIVRHEGGYLPCIPPYEQAHAAGTRDGHDDYTDFKKLLIGNKHPRERLHHIETIMMNRNWQLSEACWLSLVQRLIEYCTSYSYTTAQIYLHAHFIKGTRWQAGKRCQEWFIEHPEEFERLRYEVGMG